MKKQILVFIISVLIIANTNYSYNPEHLRVFLINDPHDYFQKWRKRNPRIRPDLSYAVLKRGVFNGDLSDVNFKYAQITDFYIGETNFIRTNFSYSILKKLTCPGREDTKRIFFRTTFFKAQLTDSVFFKAKFINANFNEAEIQKTNFSYSTFKHVSFVKARIVESKLDNSFFEVDFSHSHIVKSLILADSFFKKRIANVKFDNAKIYESTFSDYLINVSYINSDLTNTSFYYSDIPEGSVLINVNFTNANLTNVNFQKAKFHNVIFKNADMTGAKLERKWVDYVKKQGVRNFDKIQWQ